MTSEYNQNYNLYTKIDKNLEANKKKYNLSKGFDRKTILEMFFNNIFCGFILKISHDENNMKYSFEKPLIFCKLTDI
jgi:hypothetical protein